MATSDKRLSKKYFDCYLYGGLNSQGQIKEVYDIEAIKNAIILWLGSFKGEYVNNPTAGGYLTYHLAKPMNNERTEMIRLSILQGFKTDFFPSLIVTSINVEPDYKNRFYDIEVTGYSPIAGVPFQIGEKFRNFG